MELKKHFEFRYLFWCLYFLLFAIYIIIGLRPVNAANYDIDGRLAIPEINLSTDVASLALQNNRLDTPDEIAGSYSEALNKTLIIGHSTTIFKDLHNLSLNDTLEYDGKTYIIKRIETVAKSNVRMSMLLREAPVDTIVLMTCAGELLGNGDATHRLIITAIDIQST